MPHDLLFVFFTINMVSVACASIILFFLSFTAPQKKALDWALCFREAAIAVVVNAYLFRLIQLYPEIRLTPIALAMFALGIVSGVIVVSALREHTIGRRIDIVEYRLNNNNSQENNNG